MDPIPGKRIPVPPELLEEARASQTRGQDIDRANAHPLPGPLAKAFGQPQRTRLGNTDIYVRPIVSRDWDRLVAIGSPLVNLVVDQATQTKTDWELKRQDQWEIVFLFTHPAKECSELIEKGTFSQAACNEIGEEWPDSMVSLALAVVMTKVKESWETAVKFASEMEEKGEVTFFRVSGETQPKTALAGNSTMNAALPEPSPAGPSTSSATNCP